MCFDVELSFRYHKTTGDWEFLFMSQRGKHTLLNLESRQYIYGFCTAHMETRSVYSSVAQCTWHFVDLYCSSTFGRGIILFKKI